MSGGKVEIISSLLGSLILNLSRRDNLCSECGAVGSLAGADRGDRLCMGRSAMEMDADSF